MNIYKKIIDLFKIIIVVIFCLNSCLFSAKAQSSNVTATAADLSYNFLGLTAENKPTYEVKLHLYYHCINNNNIASLGFAPVALTYLSDTVVKQELFLALQDIQNATPLCVQNANDSNCDVGNINGMMRYTYSNISEPLILNEVGKNWELHFSEISRNPEITNIQNPNSVNLYVKAIIYNNNGQNYSSPQFDYLKMPYFCIDNPDTLKQYVTNGNNANISYTSMPVLGGNQENSFALTYEDGFSAENPLSTSNYFFDTQTGNIIFTPTETQNAILAIWVEERDSNGNVITATMRNIQVVVLECENAPLSIDSLPTSFLISPFENLNFDINISDANIGDTISIVTNIISDFPSEATTNIIGTNNNLSLNFDWTPTLNDKGLYYFVIHAQDNHCPIMSYQVVSIPILVACDIITERDTFAFCPNNASEIEIFLTGSSSFFWQPEPQNLSENGAIAILSPTENTNYIITNSCGVEKNISIEIKDGFSLSNFSDLQLCQNETTTLTPIVSPANQNYTYNWTSHQSIDCTDCSTIDIVANQTTTYTLHITDDFGCETEETIIVEVENLPDINIEVSKIKVFTGESVDIKITDNDWETISWNNGNTSSSFSQIINETTTFTVVASNSNGCTATKSITIEAICKAPSIPSAFSPNNDGINDNFAINYFNFQEFSMKIYNRWGKLIFETNDQNEGWNGKAKNRICDIGTYLYVIRAKIDCESIAYPNGQVDVKGNITLIR